MPLEVRPIKIEEAFGIIVDTGICFPLLIDAENQARQCRIALAKLATAKRTPALLIADAGILDVGFLVDSIKIDEDGLRCAYCGCRIKTGRACAACWTGARRRAMAHAAASRKLWTLSSWGSHTEEEWKALVERSGRRCLRCKSAVQLTKDHIRPLLLGGSNTIDNLQPLCWRCKAWKATRTKDFRDHPLDSSRQVHALNRVPC